ncbi:MAG: hypothetical protein N2C14_27155 [Planctomycetales bacterium]
MLPSHTARSHTARLRSHAARILFFLSAAVAATPAARAADVFDRHTATWLKQAPEDAEPRTSFTSGDAAKLKNLDRSLESPLVVARTNSGNWSKLLLSWGFRKSEEGELTPVIMVDRFVTYNADQGDQAVAAGRDVMLFEGFEFNLDLGQVVPSGHGGDLAVRQKTLKTIGKAKLFPLDGSLLPPPEKGTSDPLDHKGVLPRDFTGTWNVNADGRWIGQWELKAEEDGSVLGKFISEKTQSTYEIHARTRGKPHRLIATILLANANAEAEIFLWTTDKSRFAGKMTMLDHTFGIQGRRVESGKPAKKSSNP